MGNIILHDKEFRPFIEATKIDQVITRMAEQMNRELADTQPLFLSILNGSFMFTSDLIKQIVIPGTQISFVKVASYSGTCSTSNPRVDRAKRGHTEPYGRHSGRYHRLRKIDEAFAGIFTC